MQLLMLLPIIIIIIALIINTLPYMYGARYAGLQKIKDKTQMGFWDAFFNLFVAGIVGEIASEIIHPLLGIIVFFGLIYYFLKRAYNPTTKQYAIVFGILIASSILLAILGQFALKSIAGAMFGGGF